MNPIQTERPLYLLPQNKSRVIVPKLASLIVLGTIFYIGILLNLSLLQLNAEEQNIANIFSLVFLFLIVILGVYLGYHQVSQPYRFYQNRLALHRKDVFYNQIGQIQRKQSVLDKIFKTYSLDLGNKQTINNIPQQTQIDTYLQQLVNYSKNFSR
ncbi:MAG: hypothetical protein V2A62_04430 [Candidatus Woesearchaeota archaeon]